MCSQPGQRITPFRGWGPHSVGREGLVDIDLNPCRHADTRPAPFGSWPALFRIYLRLARDGCVQLLFPPPVWPGELRNARTVASMSYLGKVEVRCAKQSSARAGSHPRRRSICGSSTLVLRYYSHVRTNNFVGQQTCRATCWLNDHLGSDSECRNTPHRCQKE
jgi:hypothetical protein